MPYSRGDVVLVRFPDSNLKTYKKRPALVIQADNLPTGLSQRIVAMITSNMTRTGTTRCPVQVNGATGTTMGLLTDSVIVTDCLATVWDRAVDKVIGKCPIMPQVDQALRITLAL